MKPRAIVIRVHIDAEQKKTLTRYFRKKGYGLRTGLRYCCMDAVIIAGDDEREEERNRLKQLKE